MLGMWRRGKGQRSNKKKQSFGTPRVENPLISEYIGKSFKKDISSTQTFEYDSIKELGDRYMLSRVLGKGGFGIVHLGEDAKLGRLVAIKKLDCPSGEGASSYDAFIQEARIAGSIDHPNVVTIYNIEELDSVTYIIMEYIGGGSLWDLMSKRDCIPPTLALKLMIGIMTGLDAAHHLGVVHRDIKPANILLGIGNTPKITDFGAALYHKGPDPMSTPGKLTIVGTPEYVAPEFFDNVAPSAASDIYSAGAVFYHMLAGVAPQTFNVQDGYSKIRESLYSTPIPLISDVVAGIPSSIDDILAKMLERDPEKRYKNALAVVRDLTLARSAMKPEELDHSEDLLFSNSPHAILYDTIQLLLLDNVITSEERDELNKRAERLGVSPSEVESIEMKVRAEKGLCKLTKLEEMKEAIAFVMKENKGSPFSDLQKQFLREKQHQSGITNEEIDDIKSELLL